VLALDVDALAEDPRDALRAPNRFAPAGRGSRDARGLTPAGQSPNSKRYARSLFTHRH